MTLSILLAMATSASPATWKEAKVGTRFQVFVPPNNLSGTRFSSIVVTAQAGTAASPTRVDLIDDGADGDSDDTQLDVSLAKGESLVRYLKDGAVNDDGGGTWDGDFFIVESSQPVSVSFSTDSDWQHDWAPADNGLLRGTRFFLYTTGTSVSNRDVDVFAYEDGTRIELYDVTNTPLAAARSGIARIAARPASALLQADLLEGEDTMRTFGLGRDLLVQGRTYELVATRPVTVMVGAIDSVVPQNQARDGAGYVPGRSGTAQDDLFYFAVPHNPGLSSEQEIRIVAADPGVSVELDGRAADGGWATIGQWSLPMLGHADVVGPNSVLFRLRARGGRVNVYEANWMETGSPGTSDESDFVPGHFNADGSASWVTYLGPPGTQTSTSVRGTFTHLYLFSMAGAANVSVRDTDTNGGIFSQTLTIPPRGFVDVRIDTATWSALNRPAQGVRPYLSVDAPGPLAVNMSNWNDNWMAYATAVLPLNPVIQLSGPSALVSGEVASWSGSISNVGSGALTDAVVRLTLAPSMQYLGARLAGASPSAVTTFDGGTEVRFSVPTIDSDEVLPFTATAFVTSTSSGSVLPLDVSATATSNGVTLGSSGSTSGIVENPAVVNLADFSAVATELVQLTWFETAEVGVTSTVTIQRGTSPSGPWSSLAGGTSTSVGQGATVSRAYLDATVTSGSNLYYRLVATGTAGASATAGPILAQPRDVTPPPVPTLRALAGDRTVTLAIGGSLVTDLAGYTVERSRSGSTAWTRLNANPIAGPTLLDSGLQNGTGYAYRAFATDSTGNRSATSGVITVVPTAVSTRASELVLGFEDMIGVGENDWDYNDFLVRTAVVQSVSGGVLSAVQIDYEPLARGAGYIHEFRQALPLTGAWSAVVTIFAADAPATIVSSRTFSGTGLLDLEIYADTRYALPAESGAYTNTPKTQAAFVAGRTARLVVTLSEPDTLPGSAPWDCYLRLPYLAAPNEVHRAEQAGAVELTASGPLAGRELDFVEEWAPTATPAWPYEGAPLWGAFSSFAPWRQYGRDADRDWATRPTTGSVFQR